MNNNKPHSKSMKNSIEYGDLTVSYDIEGDVDGPIAIIKSISGDSLNSLDKDTIGDIRFHCVEDYTNRQWNVYLKTGEII